MQNPQALTRDTAVGRFSVRGASLRCSAPTEPCSVLWGCAHLLQGECAQIPCSHWVSPLLPGNPRSLERA